MHCCFWCSSSDVRGHKVFELCGGCQAELDAGKVTMPRWDEDDGADYVPRESKQTFALKDCSVCGEVMQPRSVRGRQVEGPKQYARRQTCGYECGKVQTARTKTARGIKPGPPAREVPLKRCSECGVLMERRQYNGQKEPWTKYFSRQTCSVKCRGKITKRSIARAKV